MAIATLQLSQNARRNKKYHLLLKAIHNAEVSVADIVHLGHRLMQKENLHHHFFGNHTLLANAEYLTSFALGLDYQNSFNKALTKKLTEEEALRIIYFFEKRIAERLPVEYLTNEAWYLGRSFYVNEHVLIPRSIMNTRFTDFLQEICWDNYPVLDLCTGSGCIGITLALLDTNITVDLVDISSKALEVATINIKKHGLKDRVRCIRSDLFENIQEKYDLIITNPPYVSVSEYQRSPMEFKKEPQIALESGADGLTTLHEILKKSAQYLNPQGLLIAEVGVTAAKRLKRCYPKSLFTWLPYRKPTGKVSWFAMDGILIISAQNLHFLESINRS